MARPDPIFLKHLDSERGLVFGVSKSLVYPLNQRKTVTGRLIKNGVLAMRPPDPIRTAWATLMRQRFLVGEWPCTLRFQQ